MVHGAKEGWFALLSKVTDHTEASLLVCCKKQKNCGPVHLISEPHSPPCCKGTQRLFLTPFGRKALQTQEATRSVVSPLTVRLIQHQWISELLTGGLGLERLLSHKGSTEYTEGAPCALKTHTCNGSLLQSQ